MSSGEILYQCEVDDDGEDTDDGQLYGVGQHQGQIEHQQSDVDHLRRQHLYQCLRDGLVQVLTLLDLTHLSHGKERHRQA